MRCHYVPQFYLKNFSISTKPDFVYAYRRSQEPFETSIQSVAVKNNLYIFRDKLTGKKSDEVEKMFAWLEGLVAPIIDKIIKQKTVDLLEQERVVIAEFIAYLHTRNLSFREKQKAIGSAILKQQLKLIAQDETYFKECLKKATNKVNFKDDKKIEKLRQQALNFDQYFKIGYGKKNEDFFLKQALLVGVKLAPIIFHKEWHLLENRSSRIFTTSDNPVLLIRPQGLPPIYGVGFANGYIAVPISPSICILLKNDKGGSKKVNANRETVDFINRHTMFFAHKFIYSNILSKDIKSTFNQTKEGASERVIIN